MGDAQWTSGEAAMNFDMRSFYANFIKTMSDTQVVECSSAVELEGGRPPNYECCSLSTPTFGCDWTGTNFTNISGALPDVVPYGKKTCEESGHQFC